MIDIRFQACLYFAAVFQSISCGIHYLASVFLVETPNFVCGAPDNITAVLYGNVSGGALADVLPLFPGHRGDYVAVRTSAGDQWELGRCGAALRVGVDPDPAAAAFAFAFGGNTTAMGCGDNFVFDRSQVYSNIVTDWHLVCDGEWLAKLCQPTFMLGVLVGALVFGDIADRVGRVKILMLTSTCQFVFGVLVAFTGNYYWFVAIRFLLAMVSSGYLVVVFVYVTEFTGIKVRTWTSMHVHAAFAVGIMVVALMGYLVRVWWIYQIVLSLITSPFLFFCWNVHLRAEDLLEPEEEQAEQDKSAGELLENQKQAEERGEKEAAGGEVEVQVKAEKKLSILDLFGSWRMAGRTCTVWAIWFIGSLGYYVFSLGSMENPRGRKKNLWPRPADVWPGCACMLIIVVPAGTDIQWLAIALSMTGKFAIAIAFGLIYLYSCELYPTIIRSLALIVGILAFIIGVLTLLLPETLGKPLTNTLEEAEALGDPVKKKKKKDDKDPENGLELEKQRF
ncbi:hypothetical protein CRUP_004903 [Coryphaenoides rupestris]|nr:hypothetical protein CRUP_004903 [Coryphaenoides rupestris]